MFGKRFEKEFKMIENAIATESGELELRKYLLPQIKENVKNFLIENPNFNNEAKEVECAAWAHLSIAIKNYYGRAQLMTQGKNDVFYFATYFDWFIRQGMLEYKNSKKKPD